MTTNPKWPPRLLPVLDTVGYSFRYLWDTREKFMFLAFPGIVLLSILNTLLSIFFIPFNSISNTYGNGLSIELSTQILFSLVIGIPVVTFFVVCFAVSWHRLYLVNDIKPGIIENFKWGSKHSKFLLLTIVLTVMMTFSASATLLISPFGSFSFFITLLILLFIYSRFSFVLPASAVDDEASFGSSWLLTKGNTFRVAAVIGIVWGTTLLLTVFAGQIMYIIIPKPSSFMGTFVIAFIFRFLSFISIALIVTVLSVIYEELSSKTSNRINLKV